MKYHEYEINGVRHCRPIKQWRDYIGDVIEIIGSVGFVVGLIAVIWVYHNI